MLKLFRRPHSLSLHLAGFAATLVLPLLFVAGLATSHYVDSERQRLEAVARKANDELLGRVERELAGKIVMLEALATSPALDGDGDPARFDQQARALARDGMTIVLVDAGGTRHLVNTRLPPGAALPADQKMTEASGKARLTKKLVVSDLMMGQNTGQPLIELIVPALRDGEVKYLIAAVFRSAHIAAIIDRQGLAPPFYASVVDRTGRIIARSSRSEEFVGKMLPGISTVVGSEGTWSGTNPQGVSVLAFFRRSEVLGWFVTLGVDQAAVRAPLYMSLKWLGALAAGLCLITIVLAAAFTRRLQSARRALTGAAAALGRGEPVSFSQTPISEVNHVGAELVSAANELRHRSGQLTAANHALEQRVAERTLELEQARDKAEAAGRAKAEFLANMSHELRTPLTAMIGVSELLLNSSQHDKPENLLRYLAMQRDAGQGLLSTVNDILDFSKIEAGHVGIERLATGLGELVGSCVDLVSQEAGRKGLALGVEISPDLPDRVLVDPTRTRQILLNLLANAVKFTASGSVRLTVNKVMRGSDPYLSFAIADTGIGIAPDKLPKLFDRFLQADSSTTRRFGGTGLGLAISKGLIQLLGGALEVSSRLGVGSTFTFTLPLLAAAIGAAPAAPTGSQALQSGPSRRILLAEDNSMNQEIISVMLRQAGHEVAVVGDGLQAVTRAGENPGAFDLILMDIQMPVMDGCEAAMLLRDRACRLPIVALTANAMSDEIERCLRSGMDTHLAKPIAWPQLFAAIDRLTRNGHPHVQYRDRAQYIEPI